MPFFNIMRPENAEFVPYYNALLQGCQKRGFCLARANKEDSDSVFHSDLNALRTEILAARTEFFDPELLDLTLDDPFSDPNAVPKINDDNGFLMVPGKCTSTGAAVHREDGLFSDSEVPVLREHFDDLRTILNKMQHRKCGYSAELHINRGTFSIRVWSPFAASQHSSPKEYGSGRFTQTHTAALAFPENHPHDDKTRYSIYQRQEGNPQWNCIDQAGSGGFDATVNKITPSILYDSNQGKEWYGRCNIQLTCDVNDEMKVPELKPLADSPRNGVAQIGCNACGGCCDPAATPYRMLQQSMGDMGGTVDLALAMSFSEGCSMQIGHYMTEYPYAGETYGQYNCDTRIWKHYAGAGNGNSWEFDAVLRPSGAVVPFYWKNNRGNSLNENSYYLKKENGITQLHFTTSEGDDVYFIHVFGNGGLTSCKCENLPLSSDIPGAGVTRTKSGDNYSFHSRKLGAVTMAVNSRGKPLWSNFIEDEPETETYRRSRNAVEYDRIARLAQSDDPADAANFDFADFFPAGEAPEFGAPVRYHIMDYYNQSEIPMGKFIEITYADGNLGRGYWNKQGGQLTPAELSLFKRERVPDTQDEFYEITANVRYGATGRSQAQRRTHQKSFAFGEQTIREYRKFGTDEQREAVYEYGTDLNSGSYGKLTFSSDFDGGWERREYDAEGRLTKVVAPFMDAAPDAEEPACAVTTYDYAPVAPNETAEDTRPRTIVRTELGTEVSREYNLYFANETRRITAAAPGAAYDDTANQIWKTFTYAAGDFAGRQWKTENPDGSSSLVTYAKKHIAADGGYELETTTLQGFLPNHGTRTATLTDVLGNTASSASWDIESGLQISGNTYTYDRFGRVLTETTLDGDVTTTEYNCCGPRFVTDPAGSVTEYAHDVFGRQSFSLAAGVTTFHAYDANDNEIATTVSGKNGGELATAYEFDADGEMIQQTDAGGATTAYARGMGFEESADALGGTLKTEHYRDGRVKAVSGTAAVPKTYEYGIENGEAYTREIASANEWVKTFTDFLGRQYKRTYPDGYAETNFFDAAGRVIRTENTLGEKTLQVYDAATGKLKYQVRKRTENEEIDFANDDVTETADGYVSENGAVLNYQKQYRYFGGVRQETASSFTRRDGKYRRNTENGRTTVSTTVNENDGETVETTINFDGTTTVNTMQDGVLQSSAHSVLGLTEYTYDEFNRNTGSDHDENGVTVQFRQALDAMGRSLSETVTAGELSLTTTHTCDLLGNKLSDATPEGRITTYAYTSRGELATVDGAAYRQTCAYDAQGRMTSLTTFRDDETPETTSFEYDSRGNLTKKTYADGTFETTVSRGDGKPSSHANVRGQTQSFNYNAAGEQTAMTSGEDISRTFTYDAQGRLTGVTDAKRNYTFTLDAEGHVTAETGAPATVGRSYDAFGRQTELTLDGAPLAARAYGADGRLASIACGEATLSYNYRPGSGEIASASWRIGENAPFLTLHRSFDATGRLTEISTGESSEIEYALDNDGRRTSARLPDGSSWHYEYDLKSQLTSANRSSGETALNAMNYSYDEIGNRLTATEDETATAYTSNDLNQYTSINAAAPSYDSDGNMLTLNGWTFEYNSENRLISAASSNIFIEFFYDYLGRRVEKKVNLDSILIKHEKYTYDGYKLIAIHDGLNEDAVLMTFTWQAPGLDVPLNMKYNGHTYYYLTDGNKNVTGLFDNTGARVASYTYGPFGQVLSSTGPLATTNPLQFSSEFHDPETSLTYYNYRYYSASLGRWLRRDPIGEEGGKNLYGMCLNNTINAFDLLGLQIKLFYGNHPVIKGFYHSKLWLVTNEEFSAKELCNDLKVDFVKMTKKQSFENFCRFISTGAGEDGDEGYELVADFNRDRDKNFPLMNRQLIRTLSRSEAAALIEKINKYNKTMNENFKKTYLEYDLFPGESYTSDHQWFEYNSNSYVSGLLRVLGFTPPPSRANTPGYIKPVPDFIFTQKFEDTDAIRAKFKKVYR